MTESRDALPDRRVCAEIKAGRDCPVHGKVHGPTGIYTPPDWDAIVDDAVHEIDLRWGEPVDDDESAPMDRQIVGETAEAVLRPVVAERDRLRAENEALKAARDWTTNKAGRSNSSDLYHELSDELARLLRSSGGQALSREWAHNTARLILAQLAHAHRFGPLPSDENNQPKEDR